VLYVSELGGQTLSPPRVGQTVAALVDAATLPGTPPETGGSRSPR
jgi:hypothetical protein